MKKIFLSIIFLFIFNISALSHINHYDNYNYLEYELFRNDKLIGNHKYFFDRKKNLLSVKSVVKFKISKLGVDLYKYSAESEEIYENDQFFSFKSKTLQNKKNKYVNIVKSLDNAELEIDGSSYRGKTSKKHVVGTWWNHEIIKTKAQISAISGRVIKQDVNFLGKKKIMLNGKSYNALHFNFSSSDVTLPDNKKLNTDIWYEENTFLWLKASFIKSGNWEYRLKVKK